MKRCICTALAGVFCAAAAVGIANAQTTWEGDVSNDATDTGNWSAGVPTGAGTTLDASATSATLDLMGAAISGGGTTVSGTAYTIGNSGALASWAGGFTVNTGASADVTNVALTGTVTVAGELVVNDTNVLANYGGVLLDGGQLTVTDDILITSQYPTGQFQTTANDGTLHIAAGKTMQVTATGTTGWFNAGQFPNPRVMGDLHLTGAGRLELIGDTILGGWLDAATGEVSNVYLHDGATISYTVRGNASMHLRMLEILDGGTAELIGIDEDQSDLTIGDLHGGGRIHATGGKSYIWGVDKFGLKFMQTATAANPAIIDVDAGAELSIGSNQTQGGLASDWVEVPDAPGVTGQDLELNDLYPVSHLDKVGEGVFTASRSRFWNNQPKDALKMVYDVKEGILSATRGLGGDSNLGPTAPRDITDTAWVTFPYRSFHRSHLEGMTVRDGARLEWSGDQGFFDNSWWISEFPLSVGDGWNSDEFVIETGGELWGGAPTNQSNSSKTLQLGFDDPVDGVFLAYPTITDANGKSALLLGGGIDLRSGINLDASTPLLDITTENFHNRRVNLRPTPGAAKEWMFHNYASDERVVDFSNTLAGAVGVDVFQSLHVTSGTVRIRNDHANVTSTMVDPAGPDVLLGYNDSDVAQYQAQDSGVLEFAPAAAISYTGTIDSDGVVRAASGNTSLTGTLTSNADTEISVDATLTLDTGDATNSIDYAGLSIATGDGITTFDGKLALTVKTGATLTGATDVAVQALVAAAQIEAVDTVNYTAGYKANGLDVDVLATLPGDANLDGTVDLNDASTLLGEFGAAGAFVWEQGDFTHDTVVDLTDASALLGSFGSSLSPGAEPANVMLLGSFVPSLSPGAESVPEPASVMLLGLGGLAILRRRR